MIPAAAAQMLDMLAEVFGTLSNIDVELLPASRGCWCADLGDEAPCGWCDGPDREVADC